MSIENALRTLSERVRTHSETISTEEAAKTSIVLPFLQALGYDVFDPGEVVPEFTADAMGKRGEKVDYAIRINGQVSILVECKSLTTRLDQKCLSQLFRYFTVTTAKFAILTNGRIFEFYSDLEAPNKLDTRPFLAVDLLELSGGDLSELSKFEKSAFDVGSILATAEHLKHVSAVKKYLRTLIEEPNDRFVRMVAGEVHDGRVSAQIREQVQTAIRTAFRDVIREEVRHKLSSALESNGDGDTEFEPAPEIETTQAEIEGMLTIRAIVGEVIETRRVDLRDAKSYCAVLIDDNNRKPLARLHFNRAQWYLGLFDGDAEERVAIGGLDDIYRFSGRLKDTARKYV